MNAVVLRLRWLLSGLLIAGAALFAVGVGVEHSRGHHDTVAVRSGLGESAGHDESLETGTGDDTAEHSVSPATASEANHVFGFNLESTPLVIAAVAVSLLAAVVVWRRSDHGLLWAVVAFAIVFAVLDVGEVVHDLDERRRGIAVIAIVVTLLHAAAAFVAERRAVAPTRPA